MCTNSLILVYCKCFCRKCFSPVFKHRQQALNSSRPRCCPGSAPRGSLLEVLGRWTLGGHSRATTRAHGLASAQTARAPCRCPHTRGQPAVRHRAAPLASFPEPPSLPGCLPTLRARTHTHTHAHAHAGNSAGLGPPQRAAASSLLSGALSRLAGTQHQVGLKQSGPRRARRVAGTRCCGS